jgi:cysteine desulfuration protein SufE
MNPLESSGGAVLATRGMASNHRTPGTAMSSLDQIIDDFAFLDEWEDRYRYLIELGKSLPEMPLSLRTSENKVQGCASQVWLATSCSATGQDPRLVFEGESDAHIVRGLVAIALTIFSGKPASEIASIDALEVFGRIGLIEHLSSQRANGLRSMIARIKREAACVSQTSPTVPAQG